ncbi:rab5 GDP/GTP exchange factor-like isoform X2 [Stegodyphus dumicola]|uniref:rab5 GDP/GTP exchange factor-like isoform X2 n=1 Tax=Stegodyphus dumicola TaxID=202533 RepID=UPI0015ABB991|nr:rab5 GDP/GTP exchange factor-like isoform X2 [Stegodyphus dumicola]
MKVSYIFINNVHIYCTVQKREFCRKGPCVYIIYFIRVFGSAGKNTKMSLSTSCKIKYKAAGLHGHELKCKNKCGYYGNPEWQGYCSKCYRELNQKIKPDRDIKGLSKKITRSFSDAQDSSLVGFSKFEEKKKQQSEKRSKTIKSIIKRGQTMKESTTHSPSRDVLLIGEVLQLSKDLQLKEPVSKDVIKQIQRQLEIISRCFDKSIDEQSEIMQDFYNFMANRCETHPYYQDMTPEQIDLLMDKIEEVLMENLHRTMFQNISSEYEEKDLALQKRIRSLNWIMPHHLFLDIKENSPEVSDLIDKAITDVIEMDSKIAPQEKIQSIVKCSKNIVNIINISQGVVASADEFLPVMVYIVLKANPPLLQSNIKYITSYSIPARLRSGEGAYYFTNLCCAVTFIENLTAESLNLSNDEFERYLAGEVPIGFTEQNPSDCEGLRLMSQNLASLNEIREKSNQVLNEMRTFQEEMENLLKYKPLSPLVLSETPYTIPADTDMSLIPEILRNRVLREGPREDILVDLECKTLQSPVTKLQTDKTINSSDPVPQNKFSDSFALPDFHSVSLESESKPISSDIPVNNITAIQSLQVAPPVQAKSITLSCDTFTSSSDVMPQNSSYVSTVQTSSQPIPNIKDLDYPTELFPDVKTDDNVLESFDQKETDVMSNGSDGDANAKCFLHPLSPESEFMEENLHLPPPLQPLVVQSINPESNDRKT